MGASANTTRVIQANMHQMVAMMRDPAFHNEVSLEFISETPQGLAMQYHFHHNMSLASRGEKVLITLMPLGADMVSVEVSSACALPTQLIDYGKNRKNVEGVHDYICRNLYRYAYLQQTYQQPAAASQGGKFCCSCGNRLEASARFCSACGAKQE